MKDDMQPITKEERAQLDKRCWPQRLCSTHTGTVWPMRDAYEAALVAAEAERDELREALKKSADANFRAYEILDQNEPDEAQTAHAAAKVARAALKAMEGEGR